jgi:hypothetical protein
MIKNFIPLIPKIRSTRIIRAQLCSSKDVLSPEQALRGFGEIFVYHVMLRITCIGHQDNPRIPSAGSEKWGDHGT